MYSMYGQPFLSNIVTSRKTTCSLKLHGHPKPHQIILVERGCELTVTTSYEQFKKSVIKVFLVQSKWVILISFIRSILTCKFWFHLSVPFLVQSKWLQILDRIPKYQSIVNETTSFLSITLDIRVTIFFLNFQTKRNLWLKLPSDVAWATRGTYIRKKLRMIINNCKNWIRKRKKKLQTAVAWIYSDTCSEVIHFPTLIRNLCTCMAAEIMRS